MTLVVSVDPYRGDRFFAVPAAGGSFEALVRMMKPQSTKR